MQDPFFAARSRRQGNPWGQHPGYVEDIHRTYNKNPLPKRDDPAFERAYQHRQRELEKWRQIQHERDTYATRLKETLDHNEWLSQSFDSLTAQYSKLMTNNERSVDDNEASGSIRRVRGDAGSLADGGSEERVDASTDDPALRTVGVQRAVLPTEGVPDPRGQASEHGVEGRLAGGDDSQRSVPVPEEPVPEGGD